MMRDDPFQKQGDGTYTVDCWNCGGSGFIEGECTCGEDCCCCLEPDEPECDVCGGTGVLSVGRLEHEQI